MKLFSAATLMRQTFFALSFFATALFANFSHAESNGSKNVMHNAQQLVLVTTKNWDEVGGELHRFERKNSGENWRAMGESVEIVVGRTGLAWGRGLHSTNLVGPKKVEGDGKSPAGIFKLSSAFGFAPEKEMKSLKLPYLPVTEMLECVDDVKSARYNSIVDRSHIINPDWNSSEKMHEIGEQYHLGIVVDHNTSPRLAGKGSCIFLHIWKGDGSGTAGCTAMKKSAMEELIRWIDARSNPLLVQLPDSEFQKLKTDWQLPERKVVSSSPQ